MNSVLQLIQLGMTFDTHSACIVCVGFLRSSGLDEYFIKCTLPHQQLATFYASSLLLTHLVAWQLTCSSSELHQASTNYVYVLS